MSFGEQPRAIVVVVMFHGSGLVVCFGSTTMRDVCVLRLNRVI